MAPKRERKKKLVGTVTRSTRKVIRETVSIAVIEGDTRESTQEEQNRETEELIDVLMKETPVRTIPLQEKVREEGEEVENIEVSLEVPRRDVPVDDGEIGEPKRNSYMDSSTQEAEGQMASKGEEEEGKEEERSGAEQEEEEQEEEENRQEKAAIDTPMGCATPLAQGDTGGEEKGKAQRGRKKVGEEAGRTTQEGKDNLGRKRKRRGKGTMKAGHEGYKRYVFKVLKQVHPELRISSMAMSVINSFMKDIFERLADEAAKLSQYTDRATLSAREIQDAVKLVLPGELGKHAIAEGSKAVTNYASFEGKKKSSSRARG